MTTNLSLFPLAPAEPTTPPVLPLGRLTLADELLLQAQPEDVRNLIARLVEDAGAGYDQNEYEDGYSDGRMAGQDAERRDTAKSMEHMVNEARWNGYADGYREGFAAGRDGGPQQPPMPNASKAA